MTDAPKKTVVIYHRADFDGLFCREIARKFVGEDAGLIGWDYGDPVPVIPDDVKTIYMLDISIDALMMDERLVWIDHHKSAIDKFENGLNGGERFLSQAKIKGYRIDGVAACRLTYQYFSNLSRDATQFPLPEKSAYIDRKVIEPLSVRLAGEYDIWDKRDPDAELFQHGLRSRDLTNDWSLLLSLDRKLTVSEIEALIYVGHDKNPCRPDGTTPNPLVLGLLDSGKAVQYAKTDENASIIKDIGFTFQWEGLTWLACNHARYNSHLFTAALRPEHDACFGFKFTGHCAAGKPCEDWSISLYHAPGKEHHDLSQIASKYGGGGHRGACGFRVPTLPFLPCS